MKRMIRAALRIDHDRSSGVRMHAAGGERRAWRVLAFRTGMLPTYLPEEAKIPGADDWARPVLCTALCENCVSDSNEGRIVSERWTVGSESMCRTAAVQDEFGD